MSAPSFACEHKPMFGLFLPSVFPGAGQLGGSRWNSARRFPMWWLQLTLSLVMGKRVLAVPHSHWHLEESHFFIFVKLLGIKGLVIFFTIFIFMMINEFHYFFRYIWTFNFSLLGKSQIFIHSNRNMCITCYIYMCIYHIT